VNKIQGARDDYEKVCCGGGFGNMIEIFSSIGNFIIYSIGAILFLSGLYHVYTLICKYTLVIAMSTKQILLICASIVIGCIIHGMIIRPARYTFQAATNNLGYVFDTHEGVLKIFPPQFGLAGFVPHTTIKTRIMDADSYIIEGHSVQSEKLMKDIDNRTKDIEKMSDDIRKRLEEKKP
jgi:hypothetical protein